MQITKDEKDWKEFEAAVNAAIDEWMVMKPTHVCSFEDWSDTDTIFLVSQCTSDDCTEVRYGVEVEDDIRIVGNATARFHMKKIMELRAEYVLKLKLVKLDGPAVSHKMDSSVPSRYREERERITRDLKEAELILNNNFIAKLIFGPDH